jgi:aspartate aminotransferase
MKLSARVAELRPSATLAITAQVNKMKAEGIDVIGFGAGEPDFDTPQNIKDAAIAALQGGFTKYTAVGGTDDAKDAVIAKLKRDQGLAYSRSEVILSCGAKHSLYNAFMALLGPGDEVLLPAPYWVSYPVMVGLAGARAVEIPTGEKTGFTASAADMERSCTGRTRAIIINSPCNPTGGGYAKKQLLEIAELARARDLAVISDEIYEKLVYRGFESFSIAQAPGMRERTVVVNGVSKTYAMTGWRIGYAAGPSELVAAMTNIQSQSTSNPVSFALKGAAEALCGPQDAVAKMLAAFDERRRVMVQRLSAMPAVSCFDPAGAFYVFPNVSRLYGRSFAGRPITGSLELGSYLLEQARVAVVPGVEFGADDYIRLSFATSMNNIEAGMERMGKALAGLS